MSYNTEHFDILIRNGRLVDGTGNPWYKADLGIIGEKISEIGRLDRVEAEIDADCLIVCPGFIDVHTHSDTSFLVDPKADSKITQGITTEIVGNCGNSAAPITELGKSFFSNRERYNIDWNWTTVAEYYDRLEANGLPLNVGTLIGHGTVRASVLGFEAREPTIEEMNAMKELVENGMKDGALGLSTGLKYVPGYFAKPDEVAELCKIVEKYDGIYATHIREQAMHLIESIEEAIYIARNTGVPVQISHLKVKGRKNWGKSLNVLSILDEARNSGIDIAYDQYPYLASGGSLLSMVPDWAREGGISSVISHLENIETREKIENSFLKHEDWIGPENIKISNYSFDRNLEGKSLQELSKLYDIPPQSVISKLLLESKGNVSIIKYSMWSDDVINIMKHPYMTVGSDGSSLRINGILGKGKPHPRNYGAFTRFLGRYVINKNVLRLEEGIRRMTSYPAKRFGLNNRGLIDYNKIADILIFDPKEIKDVATFENSKKYSKGIIYVLVNGNPVIINNEITEKLVGKTIRKINLLHKHEVKS